MSRRARPPTTPNKYLGAIGGYFRIVNSAFTQEILTLTDAGGMTLPFGGLLVAAGAAPGLDSNGVGALNIGTSNATTITLGRAGQNVIANGSIGLRSTPSAPLHIFNIGPAWTTSTWAKAIRLEAASAVELFGGQGTVMGFGVSTGPKFYFWKTTAEDASAAPTYLFTLDATGHGVFTNYCGPTAGETGHSHSHSHYVDHNHHAVFSSTDFSGLANAQSGGSFNTNSDGTGSSGHSHIA